MSTLTSGKIAEIFFGDFVDTINDQTSLVERVSKFDVDPATLQNSGNVVRRPVEQEVSLIDGFDLSGQEQGIIEQTVPSVLGTPKNDFVEQRIDDLRDTGYWERRGKRAAVQQAVALNGKIANTIMNQGSQYLRSNTTSGFQFAGEAQALLNAEQRSQGNRTLVLNDKDNLIFGNELATRGTVTGRAEEAYAKGQIGTGVAGFDVFTGSFCPNLVGGTNPDTTVTGDQSFAPLAGTVNNDDGTVTNNDYREAVIPVADSSSYNVGDKVTFENTGVGVAALGASDKTPTGDAKMFTIVSKPSGTSIKVFPRPIAADDGALSVAQKAYANIDTVILNGAKVVRQNTDASKKTNLFFDEDAIEIITGDIPGELYGQLAGGQHIAETLGNGLTAHIFYDGKIDDLTFRYRCFLWYGVTMLDPQKAGVIVRTS